MCSCQMALWCLAAYLACHVPCIEMRVDDLEQPAVKYNEPPAPPPVPAPPRPELKHGKCYHMPRERCPTTAKCARTDPASVFCCDVDSFRLKEALAIVMMPNTTNLHVLNASIEELDVSQAVFRRLASMAFTDGNIGKIVGQFPKYSPIACLNISNNNLTTAKLQPSIQRPFAYLFNLTVLDASANNLTEFPLSLVQSNRKISVDLSGNNYLPCKHFQKAMEANNNNNSSLVTFLNYKNTYCALDLVFNWFKDVKIVQIDHLRIQTELNVSCRNITPAGINCTCVPERLELLSAGVTNLVAVDCSRRHLAQLPANLPPNTVKLNVSYNNITSLQAVSDDPSYEHLRQLIVDYNDIDNIVELEGSKFIDNFMYFSISHNKLKTIHTYVLSNKFDTTGIFTAFSIGGNYIHCDCNTEKVLKPWLLENSRNIPDYRALQCAHGGPVVELREGDPWLLENSRNIPDYRALQCAHGGPVVELREGDVCHAPRDWTDYIYYIIALEALVLALLVAKVSYDYWVFKSAGYLPWPANKMPRLPCDWLCE
ncbi:Protein halfway [Papilio machaon]|uniref:Protein halfway n=1 Tax=Papilio machaon TaxID=76193 RepID=A0A194RC94_PAPMA|nr:Protein halfway [Papilio machaon]